MCVTSTVVRATVGSSKPVHLLNVALKDNMVLGKLYTATFLVFIGFFVGATSNAVTPEFRMHHHNISKEINTAKIDLMAITTQTFYYTGATQSFTVPAGITSLTAQLFGASGGDYDSLNTGGLGGDDNNFHSYSWTNIKSLCW